MISRERSHVRKLVEQQERRNRASDDCGDAGPALECLSLNFFDPRGKWPPLKSPCYLRFLSHITKDNPMVTCSKMKWHHFFKTFFFLLLDVLPISLHHLSIYQSIQSPIHLSIHLSIYPSLCRYLLIASLASGNGLSPEFHSWTIIISALMELTFQQGRLFLATAILPSSYWKKGKKKWLSGVNLTQET